MNNKLKYYVENLIESIASSYSTEHELLAIDNLRDDFINYFNIDLINTNISDVVACVEQSPYLYLFKNLNIEEASALIFLRRSNVNNIGEKYTEILKSFDNNLNLNKLYNFRNLYKEEYGLELNNIEKYFKHCEFNVQTEIIANLSVFLESFIKTDEGKQFIVDLKNDKVTIEDLFDKLDDSSIRPLFKREKGNYEYIQAAGGMPDGFFVMFDKGNEMIFNISTTSSPDINIENTSVIRHAVASKIITDAIIEHLDEALKETNQYNPYYGSNIKEERELYWNKYVKYDQRYKLKFITDALVKKYNELELKTLPNLDSADPKTFELIIKSFTELPPYVAIQKKLNKTDILEPTDISLFFKSFKGNECTFKTHFVSTATDPRAKKEFAKSDLYLNLSEKKLNLVEIKVFLQNHVLKEFSLRKYQKHMSKETIDKFHDNIINRRSFTGINQIKINNPKFSKEVEKFFLENFLLNNESYIEENLKFLNLNDKNNLMQYFSYIVEMNYKPTEERLKSMSTFVEHIDDKIKNLNLNTTSEIVLGKISKIYGINQASQINEMEGLKITNTKIMTENDSLLRDKNNLLRDKDDLIRDKDDLLKDRDELLKANQDLLKEIEKLKKKEKSKSEQKTKIKPN